ncbi:MAG: DUF547 domain-containing protein, partial [Bacteroidota bacterium]
MKKLIYISIYFFSMINILNAEKINTQFFDDVNTFLKVEVKDGLVNYGALKGDAQLQSLITKVENADLAGTTDATKKAFYINAYNLIVIKAAADLYPLQSVQAVGGFFDGKKHTVAGEKMTLNDLEKKKLLAPYGDARLHFVLVCGALGCPPITNFAYSPTLLDAQLDQQTKLAINNPEFLKVEGSNVKLSQIFNWYASDFGGNKNAVLNYINQYRSSALPSNAKVGYYNYDWSLNDASNASSINLNNNSGANSSRYIVSSTIPKGSSEIKIFNNLYSQRTGSEGNLTDRSTFFTTSLSYLYGLNNNFNIGFSTRY